MTLEIRYERIEDDKGFAITHKVWMGKTLVYITDDYDKMCRFRGEMLLIQDALLSKPDILKDTMGKVPEWRVPNES